MADNDSRLTDSGIEAGSEEGITLIVVLVFLSLSFYKYVSRPDHYDCRLCPTRLSVTY